MSVRYGRSSLEGGQHLTLRRVYFATIHHPASHHYHCHTTGLSSGFRVVLASRRDAARRERVRTRTCG
eukprot:4204184-Alexandrium_andersonii.AAC.1